MKNILLALLLSSMVVIVGCTEDSSNEPQYDLEGNEIIYSEDESTSWYKLGALVAGEAACYLISGNGDGQASKTEMAKGVACTAAVFEGTNYIFKENNSEQDEKMKILGLVIIILTLIILNTGCSKVTNKAKSVTKPVTNIFMRYTAEKLNTTEVSLIKNSSKVTYFNGIKSMKQKGESVFKYSKSNCSLMKEGLSPLDINGDKTNLHHLAQKADGVLVEVTKEFHKSNHKELHGRAPLTNTERNNFNNNIRPNYWRARVNKKC